MIITNCMHIMLIKCAHCLFLCSSYKRYLAWWLTWWMCLYLMKKYIRTTLISLTKPSWPQTSPLCPPIMLCHRNPLIQLHNKVFVGAACPVNPSQLHYFVVEISCLERGDKGGFGHPVLHFGAVQGPSPGPAISQSPLPPKPSLLPF